jgi:hypothetical protein
MAEGIGSKRSSVGEGVASIVTIVLTILGLAHVAPTFLVAIATIAFGAALLVHGAAMIGEYARYADQAEFAAVAASGGGLSTALLAGAGGIILGILALLGIDPVDLTAIAVIAFGSALILSSNSALRLHMFKLAAAQGQKSGMSGELIASEMLSSSAGMFGLTGLAAIVLGILALAGFAPVVLVLVALLALGAVNIVAGVDLTGAVVNRFVRA